MTGSVIIVGMAILLALTAVVSLLLFGPGRDSVTNGFDPADQAELTAVFAQVAGEEAPRRLANLERVLRLLVIRQVPLRRIEPAATREVARLAFADGTVVLARSGTSGSIGSLARSCSQTTICPEGCVIANGHIRLELAWVTGRVWVEVVGRDQID